MMPIYFFNITFVFSDISLAERKKFWELIRKSAFAYPHINLCAYLLNDIFVHQ